MATSDSTEKLKLSEGDLEKIKGDLYQAGMMFLSIREWALSTDAEVNLTSVEAMCEKGGYLIDRCLPLLGTPGINRSFDSWAGLNRPAAEAAGVSHA